MEKVGQPQQVGDAKQTASRPQGQGRIRLAEARPRGGNRAQPSMFIVKTHSILAPGLVPGDHVDLPATLRMERMNDSNNSSRFVPIMCSRRP